MNADQSPDLGSGELAALAGVSKDTLRFYERRRLLRPPRRAANGYRRYPAAALGRVRMIRAALSIGFTVSELSSVLGVRDAGGTPCREVRRLAGEKLERLGADIATLSRFRAHLRRVLVDWDRRLTDAGGRRAGLLEALAAIGARPSLESVLGEIPPKSDASRRRYLRGIEKKNRKSRSGQRESAS
jgi:DNA-binding transcriptional MerR regulator